MIELHEELDSETDSARTVVSIAASRSLKQIKRRKADLKYKIMENARRGNPDAQDYARIRDW